MSLDSDALQTPATAYAQTISLCNAGLKSYHLKRGLQKLTLEKIKVLLRKLPNYTFMKHIIILAFAMGIALTTTAQQTSPPFEYRPCYSAIIVSNVDTLGEWYKKVFGLSKVKEISDENEGVRIMVLESGNFTLELIELNSSLVRKDLLQGKQDGIEIQGQVKMGFNVPNMEACLKHMANLKITPTVWTDSVLKRKNLLITDPDGNKIQFFQ